MLLKPSTYFVILWRCSVFLVGDPAPEDESDDNMDLDNLDLAESDSENESVHGGSVHSAGAYEEGSQGATNRSNAAQIGSADGEKSCCTIACGRCAA